MILASCLRKRRKGMEPLDGLFKWTHKVELENSFGEPITDANSNPVVVYQRIVGDAELDLARQTALRASAILRKRLRSRDSISRLIHVPDYSQMAKENIVALIILNEMSDMRSKASRELQYPFPQSPGQDASLEDQEKYQEAVDNYFDERNEKIREETNRMATERKKVLDKYSKDRLQEIYEESAIDLQCKNEVNKVMQEMMTYLGTYRSDKFKHRAFSSFNAFRNAATHIKAQLIKAYNELEMSGEKLKK